MRQSTPKDKSISGSSFNDGFQILQAAQLQEGLSETDWTVFDGEPSKPDSANAGQGSIEDTPPEDDQRHEEPQKPALTARGRLVLEDYDIQLRLLEAQNKRRLEMARQEQAKHVVPSSHIQGPPQPMSPAVMNAMKEHPAMANRNTMGTMPPNHPNPSQTIIMLQAQVKALQDENRRLQRQLLDAKTATFAIFHRINGENGDRIYLDQPRWVRWGDKFVLEACSPVAYPEAYGLYKDLHFVVYKTYSEHTRVVTKETSQQGVGCPMPVSRPDKEVVRLVSEDMMTAMEKLAERDEAIQKKLPCLVSDKEILAPHLWWYCYRTRRDTLDGLTPPQAKAMQSLMRWMDEAYSTTHSQADDHFKRGIVSASSMGYLIQPGDVLVCKVDGGFEARLATSWLQEAAANLSTESSDEVAPFAFDKKAERRWEVDAWSYRYNGEFYRTTERLSIQLDTNPTRDTELSIADMGVFPLRFASQEVRDTLARRGKTFWECRNGKHVSYGSEDKSYAVSSSQNRHYHSAKSTANRWL
ncbi:hypothetical protein A9Z42_0054970 [Trichoderma parareesei]|uniref:DUF7025 domain-containing protein n=1 Tax=Trichoderma parareesei TaxID=858221 RepID=A0A2H3A0M4_TRIPA|nr:hypothetical protein A9Z42_0054970 [Trichoderma parareesei]